MARCASGAHLDEARSCWRRASCAKPESYVAHNRAAWRERRYYHALPHASMPGERHERVAAWTQRRRDQQQAAAAAAPEAFAAASGDEDERRDDDGDGTRSSGDELADDTGRIAAGNNVLE